MAKSLISDEEKAEYDRCIALRYDPTHVHSFNEDGGTFWCSECSHDASDEENATLDAFGEKYPDSHTPYYLGGTRNEVYTPCMLKCVCVVGMRRERHIAEQVEAWKAKNEKK